MGSLSFDRFVICYIVLALVAMLGIVMSQFAGEELQIWGLWLVFGSFVGVPLAAFLTRLGHE